MRTDLILLGTGEYSSYNVQLFRVLKPFTLLDALKKFSEAKEARPDPHGFQNWLARAGYVEDADVPEVPLGEYGKILIADDLVQIQFAPLRRPDDAQ